MVHRRYLEGYPRTAHDLQMSSIHVDAQRFHDDHAILRTRRHPVENECEEALAGFESHSLAEQDEVLLLERSDRKFLFHVNFLPEVLRSLQSQFTVLTIGPHQMFTYQNTYFDTSDWRLYLQHHNGATHRIKYRFRRYAETDVSWVEIKEKNQFRTVKERLPFLRSGAIPVRGTDAVLETKLYVNYRRISCWDHATGERLTLDFDVHFRRTDCLDTYGLANICIAELKSSDKIDASSFVRRASLFGLERTSFSKYCIGVCLTEPGELKQNRFKPVLMRLDKIQRRARAPS